MRGPYGARDCLLLGGYALYLAFGYMAFESSTLLASGGLDAASLPSVFLIAVIVVRVAVYACAALAFRKRGVGVASCVAASCVAGLLGFVILGMLVQFSGLLPFEGMMPWLAFCGAALGFGGSLLGILWVRFATTFSLRSVYLFALLSNLVSLFVYFFRHAGAFVFACADLRDLVRRFGAVLVALSCATSRGGLAFREAGVRAFMACFVVPRAQYVGSRLYGRLHVAGGHVAPYSA